MIRIAIRLLQCFALAFVLFGIVSCGSSPNRVVIDVRLNGLEERWVYLCQWSANRSILVDSVEVGSRSRAVFELSVQSPEVMALTVDRANYPVVLVVQPGDRIVVDGLITDYTVRGSQESASLAQIQAQLGDFRHKKSELLGQMPDSIYSGATDSLAKMLQLRIDSLTQNIRKVGVSYIRANCFSLSSALLLHAQVDDKTDLLPYGSYRSIYIKVDSCLRLLYPEKPIVESLEKLIAYREKLYTIEQNAVIIKAGDVIPPVSFSLIDGRTVSIPGVWAKLIIVDFWAHWCADCRNQLYSYRDIYRDYAQSGLAIVQVASDFDADSLRAIVARDSLGWMHMVEPQPYSSPLFKQLGVVKLPSNFILDRWGRVLATNVYADSLVSLLQSSLARPTKPKLTPASPGRKRDSLPKSNLLRLAPAPIQSRGILDSSKISL